MSRVKSHRRVLLICATLLIGMAVGPLPVAAHDFAVGDLRILHPNAPPTPPGVSSAAGYLLIVNEGDRPDRLIGGSAPFATEPLAATGSDSSGGTIRVITTTREPLHEEVQ